MAISVNQIGDLGVCRFVVTNGANQFWAGVWWVPSLPDAMLFKDLDDASRVCCMLRRQEREESSARRFTTTVTVTLSSERFVDLDEVRDVVSRATAVFVDHQDVPDDIQIGIQFDWGSLMELRNSA